MFLDAINSIMPTTTFQEIPNSLRLIVTFQGIPNSLRLIATFQGITNSLRLIATFQGIPNSLRLIATFYGIPNSLRVIATFYGLPNSLRLIATFQGIPNSLRLIATFQRIPNSLRLIATFQGIPNSLRLIATFQGIPNSLRPEVWLRLGGVTKADIENNYKYLYEESMLNECPHEQVCELVSWTGLWIGLSFFLTYYYMLKSYIKFQWTAFYNHLYLSFILYITSVWLTQKEANQISGDTVGPKPNISGEWVLPRR